VTRLISKSLREDTDTHALDTIAFETQEVARDAGLSNIRNAKLIGQEQFAVWWKEFRQENNIQRKHSDRIKQRLSSVNNV